MKTLTIHATASIFRNAPWDCGQQEKAEI